ncbi:nonsense-mediated mRNA decay protein [Pochonia chlamydosporia 170]|uniref:Nonsense-mediated mRNA decay protein n=1 Tax=Pochonia chlamydosporia 170 TaxID=1380566 RepID=A0A179F6D0_METCM|nr:nonsense-mediated mRNA decay protein [Pochonia chlamydosporia 170]OAQ61006.1 nonsense-mediated mRNA decay protein [Pochonia chlamydosporia 170]
MSTQPPQVLSRKANGTSSGTASQISDPAKVRQRVRVSQARRDQSPAPHQSSLTYVNIGQGKGTDTSGNTAKSSKGRGASDRRSGATKGTNDGEVATRSPRSKSQNEGEKVVVRRLPPGMTRDEFVAILGPEWEVSKGKVDWFSYVTGKISTDPSKPSRPGRAYLHLVRKDDIMPLSDAVRTATWEDAKSTFTNPSLIGPPTLEFSIYKKVPSTKKRTDARQGTIDQDPEFMAFLEGLANPAPMRDSIDVEEAAESAKADTKVTTTPLVEFLKEKKANKGKDGKNSKSGKGKGGSKDDESSGRKKGKESRGERQEKAPKETVKILTKKAATEQAAEGAKKAANQIATANAASNAAAAGSSDAPKSRRAGIAAAARILQRDLGLSPGSAHRRARHDAAKAEADAKAATSATKESNGNSTDTATAATASTQPTPADAAAQTPKSRPESPVTSKPQTGRRNRGGKGAVDKGKAAGNETPAAQPTAANPPVILKKKTDAETNQKAAEPPATAPAVNANASGKQASKERGNNKQASQKKSASVSANAIRAFVKHVNASQGVNDASLREALGSFGNITLVEIDKRKGFAYVDFSEHDALVKAVSASPIQVGQANVQVLERKDKKPAASAPAAAGKESTTPNSEKEKDKDKEKEKPSGGRGRRGRGGGKAASTATNGQATAAAAPASGAAATSTGG